MELIGKIGGQVEEPKRDKTESAATRAAPRAGKAFTELKASVADGHHGSIAGQGDSTGNEPTE